MLVSVIKGSRQVAAVCKTPKKAAQVLKQFSPRVIRVETMLIRKADRIADKALVADGKTGMFPIRKARFNFD